MKIKILIFGTILSLNLYSQDFKCGEDLIDDRDQQSYSTVLINNQCWMAENLNFGVIVNDHLQKDNNKVEKTCYENDEKNCMVYGGLYTWDEALGYGRTKNNQGICPQGWHIPSVSEWQELVEFLGEDSAGYKMKVSKNHNPSWDGNNESGFTALSAGAGYDKYFLRKGSWGLFWAADENGETRAWFTQLDNFWYPAPQKYHSLYIGDYYKKFNGMSVRCLKDY